MEINNFRNLTNVKLQPVEKFNIFYGENGSGKTSLLEAIYHLSVGRSFRTHLSNRVIQADKDNFSVISKIGEEIPIGVERLRNDKLKIRLAMEDVNSIATIAEFLPMLLIDPHCHELICSGPSLRRQFVDWGVFHVEHDSFLLNWRKYQRIIKQRNAALKRNNAGKEAVLWDSELVKAANIIDQQRRKYIGDYKCYLVELIDRLLPMVNKIDIEFKSGWDSENNDLSSVLMESLSKDIKQGYTHFGPHRADLKLMIGNTSVSEVLSRGQQKMLASAMKIAQAALLRRSCEKKCIFLIDDLPSELDKNRRTDLSRVLAEIDAQVFVTGIEENALMGLFSEGSSKMFHVEQGNITEERTNK